MIKISKICDKNKNEFYADVKKSYSDLLEKIKKNEKNIYHTFEQYNKMRKIFAEKNYDIKELTIEQL